LQEGTELIKSSGGVFEVEYDGKLIFSKKACSRFPEDGEVLRIVQALSAGVDLETAQKQAVLHPSGGSISFVDWLKGKMFGERTSSP